MAQKNTREQDKKYINDASQAMYQTYLNGEDSKIQVSVCLSLLINTIELSGDKDVFIPRVYEALAQYHHMEDFADLADGKQP